MVFPNFYMFPLNFTMIFWFYIWWFSKFLGNYRPLLCEIKGPKCMRDVHNRYINYKMIMRGSDMLGNFALFNFLNKPKLINLPDNSVKSLSSRGARPDARSVSYSGRHTKKLNSVKTSLVRKKNIVTKTKGEPLLRFHSHFGIGMQPPKGGVWRSRTPFYLYNPLGVIAPRGPKEQTSDPWG
jgi:hypothetical protein